MTLTSLIVVTGLLTAAPAAPARPKAANVEKAHKEEFADLFEPHEFSYTGGKYKEQLFKYRLFVPRSLKPGSRSPLLVWLHGIGEAGSDNKLSLKYLDLMLSDRDHIEECPFFILVVQCPHANSAWFHSVDTSSEVDNPDQMLTVALSILRKTLQESPVDPDRVYLSGLSSGGRGCWEMAMRHPELFAAFVPISSDHNDVALAARLANIPIWAVSNRGEENAVERMIQAVNNCGGHAYLTVLDRGGHDAWSPTLQNPEIWTWMLAQRRGAWACWTPPPLRPWKWLHVLAVPCLLLVIVRLAWWKWR